MSFVDISDWVETNEASESMGTTVVELYKEKFKIEPEWVVRCPGRVNLIGEHIDHNGYGVLPMAIRVATFVAIGRAQDRCLHFYNAAPEKHRSASCDVESLITMEQLEDRPEWFHYFVAGWRGALESIFAIASRPFSTELLEKMVGLNVVVGGTVPLSAGLSSSSALVCAAALATLAIQIDNVETLAMVDRHDLAEIATKAERFVGTEGGGMDQACECLASADYALRIDFNPLACAPVKLPTRALFAVLHSGKEMNKAATNHYNQRVVECRLAAQVLCKRAGKLDGNSVEVMCQIRTLRHAADAFGLGSEDPAMMLEFVAKYLDNESDGRYSRQEICEILEISDDQLVELSLSANTINMEEFWLTKRARHVYSEAARVLEFERICRRAAANAEIQNKSAATANDQQIVAEKGEEKTLAELAQLMDESHTSCRDDFECSCPELDALVQKCHESGCLAARLTGAGWGGCAVALVDADTQAQVDAQAKALSILFWSEPSEGIKAFQVIPK